MKLKLFLRFPRQPTERSLTGNCDLAAFRALPFARVDVPWCGRAPSGTVSIETDVGSGVDWALVDRSITDTWFAWGAYGFVESSSVLGNLLGFMITQTLTIRHLTTGATLFVTQSPWAATAASFARPVGTNKSSVKGRASIERAVAFFQGASVAMQRILVVFVRVACVTRSLIIGFWTWYTWAAGIREFGSHGGASVPLGFIHGMNQPVDSVTTSESTSLPIKNIGRACFGVVTVGEREDGSGMLVVLSSNI